MTREEAIKVAIEMYGWLKTDREREALETLIPELRENEGERIRKYLIEELKAAKSVGELKFVIPQPTREDCIDYLEKQEIFSKNGEGCYYYHADGSYTFIGSMGFGPIEDMKINGERPKTENKSVDLPCDSLCVEKQKPVEPSDEELQRHQDELYDFKVFAAKQAKEYHISFVHDFEWNNFCAGLLSYFNEQKHAWSKEDEEMFRIISNRIEKFDEWAAEQGYPIDDPTMKQSPIAWFKDLPERFSLQPKQEWSEEDEKMRQSIIEDIEFERNYTVATTGRVIGKYNEQIAWFKSLPERFNLQPKQEWGEEDERIKRIRKAILANYKGDYHIPTFNGVTREDCIAYLEKEKDNKFAPRVLPCSAAWFEDGEEKQKEQKPHTVSIKDAEKFGNLEYERGVKDGIQSEKSRQWKPTEEQLHAMEAALRFAQCRGVFYEKDIPALESLFYKLKDIYDNKKSII